ncbi:MAG TPA: TIGR00730 family Rossman fold protein [Bacteroidales bacterium]|nr:TIGR00730 family Rossman fold protein [Bacteroidales bacterium]
MLRRIAVFCASSNKAAQIYREAAKDVAVFLARNQIDVYYGGGKDGLMGVLANTVLRENGKIIGVQPVFMHEQGWFHPGISELILVNTMAQRKEYLFNVAEAVVALPGGCGTLDELLEAITLKQLGLFNHPVVILNTAGFFNPLLQQLDKMIAEEFMRNEHRAIWQVILQPSELPEALNSGSDWSPEHIHLAQI